MWTDEIQIKNLNQFQIQMSYFNLNCYSKWIISYISIDITVKYVMNSKSIITVVLFILKIWII
jgi:hypothetical protein